MEADKPRSQVPLSSDIGVMAFVQASPLCKELPENLLGELCSAAEIVDHAPAAVVVVEGTVDDALYFIVEGSVSVCALKGSNIVELATLERPALFGEMAVLTQQSRVASVITRTEVRFVRVPGDTVRRIADQSAKFGRMLAMLMAARQKDTERKLQG